MPGPAAKPAGARARRNKHSTNAQLVELTPEEREELIVPDLPLHPMAEDGRNWHFMTIAWWMDTWQSPMAQEYVDSDIHGMYLLAVIVDDFWRAKTPRERQAAAGEIRLQAVRYGISPFDRRRLQWEIVKTEDARDRHRRRKSREAAGEPPAAAAAAPVAGHDPRGVLRSV